MAALHSRAVLAVLLPCRGLVAVCWVGEVLESTTVEHGVCVYGAIVSNGAGLEHVILCAYMRQVPAGLGPSEEGEAGGLGGEGEALPLRNCSGPSCPRGSRTRLLPAYCIHDP